MQFFMSFREAVGFMNKWVCALCGKVCAEMIDENGRQVLRTQHSWEADHIVPVVEGGPTTLENGRVLCVPCHRSETAKLRARLARAKKFAQQLDLITGLT
jgi:5-methylcytosine-specific restriction endonuclease McrA